MKYKHFCWLVLSVVAAILLYNGLVWHFRSQQVLSRKDGIYTGDLARIGYLFNHAHPRYNINDLPRRHLTFADYHDQVIDVITLGDSFSNGGGQGPNRYYQDYLASFQNLTVLNLSPNLPDVSNYIEAVAVLANSGFLDHLKPRYLLLELVERNVHHFAEPVNFAKTLHLNEINDAYHREGKTTQIHSPTKWLNTAHAKWPFYSLFYSFSPKAFYSKVYKYPLTKNLFDGPNGSDLLFFYKDLKKFSGRKYKIDLAVAEKVNHNLNGLAQLLRSKNIELIFMLAPDKLSLYGPHISGVPYPQSPFYDLFRPLPKDFLWIDTLDILEKELDKGTKELYWIDDTHWSWKASKAIFENFQFGK